MTPLASLCTALHSPFVGAVFPSLLHAQQPLARSVSGTFLVMQAGVVVEEHEKIEALGAEHMVQPMCSLVVEVGG